MYNIYMYCIYFGMKRIVVEDFESSDKILEKYWVYKIFRLLRARGSYRKR